MTNTGSPRTASDFDAARLIVVESLVKIAPDIEDELETISENDDVFEVFDLDSMDHLNVMTELAVRTGVEVPEREYPHLRTITSLAERLSGA